MISFDAVSKGKRNYTAVGSLEEGVYNDKRFIGFKLDFDKKDPTGSAVPKVLAGHTFTADERKRLEAGEKVFIDGMTSRKGKPFASTLYVGVKDGETRESLIFDFGK